jgi:hypothetical protein
MIVPAHDGDAETRCKEFKPDVVVLDLEYSVPPKHKERARSGLAGLLRKIGNDAEVFVRVDRDTRWADVRAAIHRGIKGIVLPGPEEPEEVTELAETHRGAGKGAGRRPRDDRARPDARIGKGFLERGSTRAGEPAGYRPGRGKNRPDDEAGARAARASSGSTATS